MKKLIVGVAALVTSMSGSAAEASQSNGWGSISSFYSMQNGAVMFHWHGDGNFTTPPACATATVAFGRFAIDTRTPGGQAQMASLLYAIANRKRINFYGTGTCTVWSDTETLDWILVEQ